MGQLGIYATWLSSIAYLQKQLRIFIFFYPPFFCLLLHRFILHEAIGNVLAYLYTPIVCLSKLSKLRILLYLKQISSPDRMIRSCILCKFHFHHSVFPRNTGLGTDIFIKLEYIARSLVKIKSIPDWHLFICRMETKWTKWYAMTSHVIVYRSLELLFSTHAFHFNCFFEDFNCVFTQIRCLSRVLVMVVLGLHLEVTIAYMNEI